jgi:hypothetical protein
MEMDGFADDIVEIAKGLCLAVVFVGGYLAYAYGGYFNAGRGKSARPGAAQRLSTGGQKLKRFWHSGAELE